MFLAPGPMHHAGWMSKAINTLHKCGCSGDNSSSQRGRRMGCGKLLSSSFACAQNPGHWLRRLQLPLNMTWSCWRIWRPTWTSTEMSLRQIWPSCKGICGISRRSLSPSCSLIPGHGGEEEANHHPTSHQSRRWISSEVPNTTQPRHLWTTTTRHGINQHTTLLPAAGLARRLPRCWFRDLAWAAWKTSIQQQPSCRG